MNEYTVRCMANGPWYGYERIESAYSPQEARQKASKVYECEDDEIAVVNVKAKRLKAPREDYINWLTR